MEERNVDWREEQDRFADEVIPAIERRGRRHWRNWTPLDRDDLIQEAISFGWKFYRNLIRSGKDPVEVGIHGIANTAVRHVSGGRRFAGTNTTDVYANMHKHTIAEPSSAEPEADEPNYSHAVESGDDPAGEAINRIDWETWLSTLPSRDRMLILALIMGYNGVEIAERFGITTGRVSQLRRALAEQWRSVINNWRTNI